MVVSPSSSTAVQVGRNSSKPIADSQLAINTNLSLSFAPFRSDAHLSVSKWPFAGAGERIRTGANSAGAQHHRESVQAFAERAIFVLALTRSVL